MAEKPHDRSVHTKLVELRRICDGQIETHIQKVDSFADSFYKSLNSIRSKSHQTALNHETLGKLKAQLRELEDVLVKTLAVKTRKEAKRMAIMESLSETKLKVEELHRILKDQSTRKDVYAAILLEQSKVLEESKEKSKLDLKHREEMQEAFTWYNKVLGLRIDGGHGVKFTFTNIDRKCPTKEYSFTIRHSDDVYTLIDCTPHLNGTDKLVDELNKSNGLFEFVRIMRERFKFAVTGSESDHVCDQDTASISLSSPVSSTSVDTRRGSPLREVSRNIKKPNRAKAVKSTLLSPASVRRSPRIQVMHKLDIKDNHSVG